MRWFEKLKIDRNALLIGLVALGMVLVLVFAPRSSTPQEKAEATPTPQIAGAAKAGDVVAPDCQVTQSLHYVRCDHTVTRRIIATENMVGEDFSTLQTEYEEWNIDGFSPKEIEMTRDIALFCPLHYVLMTDEAGYVAVFQNRYGDGMALMDSTLWTMESLDTATQEHLRIGMGFDTMEELRAWADGHLKKGGAL